jgi:hypothetical protein
MARTEVEVQYGSNGAKKTEKEVESLDKKLKAFSEKHFQVGLVADAAMGLTSQLTNAARAAYAFAKEGAATSSVATQFDILDTKMSNVVTRMKEQAAEALVNSGAMNVVATLTENMGTSFGVLTTVVQVLGPSLKLLEVYIKAMSAPLKVLGAAAEVVSEIFDVMFKDFSAYFDVIADFLPGLDIGIEQTGYNILQSIERIQTSIDSFQIDAFNKKLETTFGKFNATTIATEELSGELLNMYNKTNSAEIAQKSFLQIVAKNSTNSDEFVKQLKAVNQSLIEHAKNGDISTDALFELQAAMIKETNAVNVNNQQWGTSKERFDQFIASGKNTIEVIDGINNEIVNMAKENEALVIKLFDLEKKLNEIRDVYGRNLASQKEAAIIYQIIDTKEQLAKNEKEQSMAKFQNEARLAILEDQRLARLGALEERQKSTNSQTKEELTLLQQLQNQTEDLISQKQAENNILYAAAVLRKTNLEEELTLTEKLLWLRTESANVIQYLRSEEFATSVQQRQSAEWFDNFIKTQIENLRDYSQEYRDSLEQKRLDAEYYAEIESAMKNQIGVAKPLADTILGTIGAVAEVGWFQAGLNAAMETGLGIATIFTAPWESATHFAAAAQFIVAQAMAGSKGGAKGGGAKATSGASQLNKNSATKRETVTRELNDEYLVIEVDGQRLGSITTSNMNKNAKNGQTLNSEVVRRGSRRGVLS